MAAETHLPVNKETRDLLAGLFGREVSLSPAPPLVVSPKKPASVGVYVDDSLVVRAVIACDISFSAYAAAAIALMPLPSTESSLAQNHLAENLVENLYEVLNVAAALFNVRNAIHLRLLDLHPAGPKLPVDVLMRTLTLGRREDLTIDIAGYGTGRMSVIMA